MAKDDNGNGNFRKLVFGVVAGILVIWLSWASASINTLQTNAAVQDAKYDYIKSQLCEIKTMVAEHLKDTRK